MIQYSMKYNNILHISSPQYPFHQFTHLKIPFKDFFHLPDPTQQDLGAMRRGDEMSSTYINSDE